MACIRNARALGLGLIQVFQHREGLICHRLHGHRNHRIRVLHPHHATRCHACEVVQVYLTLDSTHPDIVREIQVVQHLARDGGLLELDVHRLVREGQAVELMRHGDRTDPVEGDVIRLTHLQDLGTCVPNLHKFGNAIVVHIRTDIALVYLDLLHGRIVGLLLGWLFAFRESSHSLRTERQIIVSGKVLDFLPRESHRNQIRTRDQPAMSGEG